MRWNARIGNNRPSLPTLPTCLPNRGFTDLQVEEVVEADGHAWVCAGGNLAHGQQHARHEGDAVEAVGTNGQLLAVITEQGLLMGVKTTQTHGVHVNAVNHLATEPPSVSVASGTGPRPAALRAAAMPCAVWKCGAGRSIHLVRGDAARSLQRIRSTEPQP